MNIAMKHLRTFYLFITFVAKKFYKERCFDIANSLSYTSLLSIVPLLAVIFAGLSSSPVFQELLIELEIFIFSNFIPASTEEIRAYMMSFVSKTTGLTLVGIFSLLIIALLLMWKVDQVLNNIWNVTKKRNYLKTFLTYWALLTLGPILIGFSLMATSYLTSLPIISDTAQSIGVKKYFIHIGAIFFTFIAFTLTYLIVPNTRINIRHALVGGIVATILFELSKQGFAFYISSNTTYQSIYGALSTIPIFLIWIYISWLVILFGAITSRSLDIFSLSHRDQNFENSNVKNKYMNACYLVYYLWYESLQGNGVSEQQLMLKAGIMNHHDISLILQQLNKANWIHKGENDNWYLSRDISSLTFNHLYNDLPFELPKMVPELFLKDVFLLISEANQQHLGINIKEYFIQFEGGFT